MAAKKKVVTVGGIKIEKGVPLPKANAQYGSVVGALGDMKVGDSFVVQNSTARANIVGGGNRSLKPKRFTSRRMPDGGYRVWRVE